MDRNQTSLTVYFEDPFWVGVMEREQNGRYEASKITFGAEPKDYEVYDFLLKYWSRLSFSPAIPGDPGVERDTNPKRMRRQIQRQMQARGVGTKAQQALKLQREQGQLERREVARGTREEEQERRFALRQEKRRSKRKGH